MEMVIPHRRTRSLANSVKCIEAKDFNLKNSFIRNVSNANNTSCWHDPWCGDGSRLKYKFHRLYALESHKDCMVRDRGQLVIEYSLLGVHILGSHHKWNSWIPRKVNVMGLIDRIATRSNLAACGVTLPSFNGPFCALDIEDMEHVLVNCPCVRMVWRKNWRNRLIHALGDDINSIKNEDIFPGIQRMTKLWMSARICSKLKMDWNCWVTRPFELFC
ncbi:RNA-directed DNA polymerase, eukaryota, reverse transcriptase zinc-binding domain protein [Tanacetum coccineum]